MNNFETVFIMRDFFSEEATTGKSKAWNSVKLRKAIKIVKIYIRSIRSINKNNPKLNFKYV